MSIYNKSEIKLFKKLNSPQKIQDFLNGLRFNFELKGETCFSPRMVIKYKTAHCMEGAMLAAAILEFHGHKPWLMDLRSTDADFDHVVCVFKKFGCFGAISKTNHAVLRYREPVYKNIRELAMSYFHEYFLDNGKKTLREHSELFDLRYFDIYTITSPNLSLERRGIKHRETSQSLISVKGCQPAVSLPLLVCRSFSEGGMGRVSARGGSALGGREGVKENWRTLLANLFEIPARLDKIKHFKILLPTQIKNLRRAEKIEIKTGKLVEYKK